MKIFKSTTRGRRTDRLRTANTSLADMRHGRSAFPRLKNNIAPPLARVRKEAV